MTSGPRLDLCSISDGSTIGAFTAGDYTFESTDMANYPAGTYLFLIIGTVGDKTTTATFSMVLVDPCPTATLTLKMNPFSDSTYNLWDPEQSQSWLYTDLFTVDTLVDCGDITVVFFKDDASGLTPDATIFRDDRDASTNNDYVV